MKCDQGQLAGRKQQAKSDHSRARKILIRNQNLFIGPSQGERAMLGGPEFVFWEILANGGGQKT